MMTTEQEETAHASESAWRVKLTGPHESANFALEHGMSLTIGRGPGVDLCVRDATLARRHLRLTATASGVEVQDLGGRRGTYLDGMRLGAATLSRGKHSLCIGDTKVCLSRHARRLTDEGVELLPGIVGRSRAMRRLAAEVRRYAALNRPVLIQGESGTGKDLVARALHQLSGRQGPWVPINVGGLAESLADSELFGHQRGAFTGATEARKGAFRDAEGGTLFLDELADLSPAIQVKLLRAIEEREVRPLGSTRPYPFSCRIVSACWADLPRRVGEGCFREDLYHRMSTLTLQLPPLRQRRTDIDVLAEHLLERFRGELGERQISEDAMELLRQYDWPGNIRQLGSVLYRCAARLEDGAVINSDAVRSALPERRNVRKCSARHQAPQILKEHGGNMSAAARSVGVPRSTFRTWVKRYGEPDAA